MVTSWIFLGFYRVSGLLGAFFYGPQSRVMDGVLARANCLLITTLWTAFKFVMVPIGAQLAVVFPREEFAPVFALTVGLLSGHRRQHGDLRIAVRPAAASGLGRRRRQPQIGSWHRRGISGRR